MKTNQKGFSAIKILIVLIVVGLIGGAGWLAWGRQKSADKQVSTHSVVTRTDDTKKLKKPVTTTPVQKYLELSEWHIKVPVSNSPEWTARYNKNDDTYSLTSSLGLPPDWGDSDIADIGRYKPDNPLTWDGNYEKRVRLGDYFYVFSAFYSGPGKNDKDIAITNSLKQFSEDFSNIKAD